MLTFQLALTLWTWGCKLSIQVQTCPRVCSAESLWSRCETERNLKVLLPALSLEESDLTGVFRQGTPAAVLSPANTQMLQEAHLFHNHLAVASHGTEDLEFKHSSKKSFLKYREIQTWKARTPVYLLCVSHGCCFGYQPLVARFRSWSQFHGRTLCSQSGKKAKPALNTLGSRDQIPCVSPASWVSYLAQCNILFLLSFLPFSLNTIFKHCLTVCKY